MFCSKANFYDEELSALRPTPKLEDHPLLADCGCLFNIHAATLHTESRFPIHHLRTHDAVVTGNQLSWHRTTLFFKFYNLFKTKPSNCHHYEKANNISRGTYEVTLNSL
jgi:hypothetical protein